MAPDWEKEWLVQSRCDPGVRSQYNRCDWCDRCDLGAISVRISSELGGLGLAGRPELGVELCVELRLVHGLELKWGWCVCERSVWGVSNSGNHLKVKWEQKWFYGLAKNIFGQTENIFSLTLISGGAKHGPGCKIFFENHLHPKQTQPRYVLNLSSISLIPSWSIKLLMVNSGFSPELSWYLLDLSTKFFQVSICSIPASIPFQSIEHFFHQ